MLPEEADLPRGIRSHERNNDGLLLPALEAIDTPNLNARIGVPEGRVEQCHLGIVWGNDGEVCRSESCTHELVDMRPDEPDLHLVAFTLSQHQPALGRGCFLRLILLWKITTLRVKEDQRFAHILRLIDVVR